LGKVYPNPVSERAELSINAQKQGSQATVDIYDLKGRKVRSQNLTNLSQGQNRIALQVADLPMVSISTNFMVRQPLPEVYPDEINKVLHI
jgi:hypothetical protein